MTFSPLVVTGIGVVAPPSIDEILRHHMTPHQARRLDRLSQMIVSAALQAADQARLPDADGDGVGVVAGTGLGCLQRTDDYLAGIIGAGTGHADALTFPDTVDNAPAAHVCVALSCRGPSLTVTGREVSGECAVIMASLLLGQGLAETVVVAAGDTSVERLRQSLRRLAPRLAPGEGAAALVLETGEAAERRGAREIGRLLGCAQASEPLPRPHTRIASQDVMQRAREAALGMARQCGGSRGVGALLQPEVAGEGDGWRPADGVLRSARALERLSRGPGEMALVGRAARGGTAAALVFGAARGAP